MAVNHSVRVKKFGGTSVGSVDRIKKIASDLVNCHHKGEQQLVVVSAMAQQTDRLTQLAYQITPDPSPRELDMLVSTGEQVSISLLAMAIHSLGVDAVSMTAAQVGILTDGNYSGARIKEIATDRVFERVDKGEIVIVAGFQGVTHRQEITTLGRGGSDTTATALAAALGSPKCEIFTDVEGVFTADPRIVPEAKLLKYISYREMLEYAASGSKVLHPRCIEIAKKYDVPLVVRSSFGNGQGTSILKGGTLERVAVTGVTGEPEIARVALVRVADRPGIAAGVFQSLADAEINILLIIQSLQHRHTNDISLVIRLEDAERVVGVLESIAQEVGAERVELDTDVAKVSIIGSGIASSPGVAARMFQCLAREKINIEFISTSEVRIACIIAREKYEQALKAVHKEFELEELDRRRCD